MFTVNAGQLSTLTTNWTGTCPTVTVTSSNGWNTNFDNLVYDTPLADLTITAFSASNGTTSSPSHLTLTVLNQGTADAGRAPPSISTSSPIWAARRRLATSPMSVTSRWIDWRRAPPPRLRATSSPTPSSRHAHLVGARRRARYGGRIEREQQLPQRDGDRERGRPALNKPSRLTTWPIRTGR